MKGVIKEVGPYIVAEMIGEGSFGKVYKGINRTDKSEVALKFISKKNKNKKQLEGLRSQNEMLKNINHRNIIKLLDFLETPNQMIIITEYAGENLSTVLERKIKFTYDQVRIYCKQIFDALCYLDENRIAHRDLKPQNILIQNQVIKICDFGFARKLSASTNFMNSLKGTPLYIAPEILASGPLNYTKKVDVWSFGIITYELFTGRPPFYAQDLHRLKPKILYDKVKFPKQMPIELRTLIDRMLQKNPDNRADWQQLKKSSFFSQKLQQPLSQISQNTQKLEITKEQYLKLEEPQLMKQESEKDPILDKKAKIQRLTSQQDLEQMKKIQSELLGGKIDPKKLRADGTFYQKAMSIYSSYFSGEQIVTKQMLIPITTILLYLLTKVKPNDVDGNQDITRKKQILFCAIKLAEQDTQPDTISNQLVLIGFLIKNNFDNVSIDFQTDQDILQICLREIQVNRSGSCFGNALTVLGTLASQGIITINNSEQFFIKIQKEEVLASIAQAYEPIPSKRIVLECIQKFIHPNHFAASVSKNQHQLRKAFMGMKQQVAKALLQKNFLVYNPLTIYKQPQYVESYAKILYECITVSESFRRQFLRNAFWVDFLQYKSLRIFCFAYDYICIQKDRTCLIPNEVMKGLTTTDSTKKNSLMENAFYLARAQFYLSKKPQTTSKQESTLKLVNEICESLSIQQQVKKKASRQVEGFLFMGQRVFEQVFGQTFCNIFSDPLFDKSLIPESIIQTILENILNFKPQDQLRVSIFTASKCLIFIDELSRLESSKIRQNKKILSVLTSTINFFIQNGFIFQVQSEYGPTFTKKLLFAIFNIVKVYSVVDQKKQFQLYCKVEEKDIHSLLISDNMIDKNTLAICLTILQKLSAESKYANQIIDFTGLSLVDKVKNFLTLDLDDKDSQITVQILHMLSLLIKKSEDYAGKLRQLDIVTHFPRYLQHPTNQNVRHQTLTLIGNMAKHSQYFFEDFSVNGIFPTVVDTVKRFGLGSKNKILKGIVYAVGNISFYSDRFCKDFTQLIPVFYTALTIDDPYLISNTMSTISNLLRHSNCYVKSLVQNKIIKKVIQIVMQSTQADNKLMFGLNMIKKALAYPQIFEDHPKSEFIEIYKQKVRIAGQDNECMKKIKTFM